MKWLHVCSFWKQSHGWQTWAPERMQPFSQVDFVFSHLRKSPSACWLCSCRDVMPSHFLFQRWDVNFVCCRWGHSHTLQSCCCSKILFPFSLGETSIKRSIKEEGMNTACAGYNLRVHLSTLVLSSSYLVFVLFCFFEAGLIIQCT